MCWGNDGSKAAKQQQQQADQKNAAIDQASGRINGIFDSSARAKQIQDYQNAVQQRGQTDLNAQFGDQGRNLKFSMARSGLTSGSADVDLHDRLNQDYGKGLLQVLSTAKNAGSTLKAQDEASRSRLLAQAASGIGLNDVANQAGNSLLSNLQGANAALVPQTFDSLFSGYNQYTDNADAAKSQRDALNNGLSNLFKMTPTTGSYY